MTRLPSSKEETRQTYKRSSAAFSKKFQALGPRAEDIAAAFELMKKKQPKVVELGCGDGRDAKEIMKHTTHYLGVDYAEEMIRLAKRHAPKGSFAVADIETWNIPQHTDLVFAFASLLHSKPPAVKDILHRMHPRLSSKGIVVLSLKHGDGKTIQHDAFGTRTFWLYTLDDLAAMTKNRYQLVFADRYTLNKKQWFSCILQKQSVTP